MSHGFHNHQGLSRPDAKMGRQRARRTSRAYGPEPPTSTQRQVEQRRAAKKRRQRDRGWDE